MHHLHVLERAYEDYYVYAMKTGRKPKVHHLHVFSSLVHVKSVGPHVRKVDDRSTPMAFFGYEPSTKAYRVYNPYTKKLHISKETIIEEDKNGSGFYPIQKMSP